MESSNMGNTQVPFMQQMWHNKFLLLTVFLAVAALAYLLIGLFLLLSH